MELAKGATVTHHPGEQTIPQLCHRGSALHCSLTEWWFGEAALEKNHTFLKRVVSPREEVACSGRGRGFQLALADTPGLSSGQDTRLGA